MDELVETLRQQAYVLKRARERSRSEMQTLKKLIRQAHQSGLGPEEIIRVTGLARQTVFRTLKGRDI